MTKDELKTELDALGVDYPKDAKLAELAELYAPYVPAADTGAAPPLDGPEGQPQAAQDGGEESRPETIDPDRAVVAAEYGLYMRAEPDGSATHVLPGGTECDVLDIDGEWSRVSCRIDGWVRTEFLKF